MRQLHKAALTLKTYRTLYDLLYDLPRRQRQLYMAKFHYCTIRHLFLLNPIGKSFEKLFRRTWTLSTDAVNILSVEDLFPPNSNRRLESSNHTLNFKSFAPRLEIMPKRVETSKSPFVFASLNKSSPTKRSSGNFKETSQKFNNRRRRKLHNQEYQ